jgi:RNA polymerase sigma-70 factor (ECF subfamily)
MIPEYAMVRDDRRLKALQNREPDAWLTVYHDLGGDLFGYVHHLLRGNRPFVEEIIQSIWLIAIEKFIQFDPRRGTLRNWLFAIARQQVVLHYRQKLNRPETTPNNELLGALYSEDESLATPPEIMEQLERRDVVRAAMLCLPEDRRRVLLGKYVDGLTMSELAASTSRTEKAVESLLSRSKAQLRAMLAHYFATSQKE